jgi:hypothetical protein
MTVKTHHTVCCDLCPRTKIIPPGGEHELRGWLALTITQQAGPLMHANVCPECHAAAPALVKLLQPVTVRRELFS